MRARSGIFCGLLVLVSGCAGPRGQRLCDAIAQRDVAAVRQLLDGPVMDLTVSQGTCVPAAAVFGVAKAGDARLNEIGVELVNAGLPANASWYPPGNGPRVWAIEAAAGNGNVALVRALFAVGLDVKSPQVAGAFMQATAAGHLPVVRLLVQEGADFEMQVGGETPLERATANGREDVVEFFEALVAARTPAPDPNNPDKPQQP
jgi:hypothetical protein